MQPLYRGVIFDMDDTLIDSMSQWDGFTSALLSDFGIIAEDELLKALMSMTLEESTNYIVSHFKVPREAFENMMFEKVSDVYQRAELLPEAGEYLAYLHAHGIQIALATANMRPFAELALKQNGILEFFTCILCADEEGVNKKSSVLYQKAAQKLGLLPTECIVFEDLYEGLKSAKQAGFYTIAVVGRYENQPREKVMDVSDFAITDYRGFQNWPIHSCDTKR